MTSKHSGGATVGNGSSSCPVAGSRIRIGQFAVLRLRHRTVVALRSAVCGRFVVLVEWSLCGVREAPVDGGVVSGSVGVPVGIYSLVGEDGVGIGVGEAVAPGCAVCAQARSG